VSVYTAGTHEKGRPVLIGTDSVEASEELAEALKDLSITAKVHW